MAGPGSLIDGLQGHEPHEPTNAFLINAMPGLTQHSCHPFDTIEWGLEVLLVDATHEFQILGIAGCRLVVVGRWREVQERALPANGELQMRGFDHEVALACA